MPAKRSDPSHEAEDHFEVSCNILLLQHDEHLASLMQFLLEREGYGIRVITSLDDAILYIENAIPADLIMIDAQWLRDRESPLLPILRNYPRWHAVPIVSLMQDYDQNEIDRALHEGVADCLVQPFEPLALLERIRRYTDTRGYSH
jgi:DNA-binding response OmpR family regulator